MLELQPQVGAELGVERGERLVHQVDGGLADERAADGDALHLAAGEAGGAVVELVVDAHQFRDLGDAGGDRGLVEAAAGGLEREGEVLAHGEVRIERILLEDEGDVALGGGEGFDAVAADGDGAGVGALDAGDQAESRGLAGAGRAEQDDELAVGDGERKVADGAGAAEALARGFRGRPQPCGAPSALARARPEVASKSERRALSRARATVSPGATRWLAGMRALSGAVGGLDGDDLVGAEIFDGEDRAGELAGGGEADMLGADAEGEVGIGGVLVELRHADVAVAEPDGVGAAGGAAAEADEVHRRGADEVGDVHRGAGGRRFPAGCRIAR